MSDLLSFVIALLVMLPLGGRAFGLSIGWGGGYELQVRLVPPCWGSFSFLCHSISHSSFCSIFFTCTMMPNTPSLASFTAETWALGLALSAAMILGSWTGKQFIERLSKQKFSLLVEVLLVVAALSLVLTGQ